MKTLIDSIPADILCEIFGALRDAYPPRNLIRGQLLLEAESHAHLRRLGWVVVTFVARRWRSVALEYAALWSDLPIHLGPEWLQIFVSRSKDTVLTYKDVEGAAGTGAKILLARDEALTSVVPVHMYRMRKIRLLSASQRLIRTALSWPAPVLDDLAIYGDFSSEIPLFAGQAPCLRSLTLGATSTNAGLHLGLVAQDAILRRLTSLRLTLYDDSLLVHHITGVLRHTRSLEVLNINIKDGDNLPFDSATACSDARPTVLRALKTCALDGRIVSIAHLISHLRLPLFVIMTIHGKCNSMIHPSHSPSLRRLADNLAAWRFGYDDGPSEPFRIAYLHSDPKGTTTLTFALRSAVNIPSPFALPPDASTLFLEESLDQRVHMQSRPAIYSHVLPILFSHGEVLLIRVGVHHTDNLHQHLRCPLPRLQQICSPLFTDFKTIGPDLNLVPSLRVLHLISPPTFNEAAMQWFYHHASEPNSAYHSWESLRSTLSDRRSAGMALERIVIHEGFSMSKGRMGWPGNRYETVKSFMEDVIEVVTVQNTEDFWKVVDGL